MGRYLNTLLFLGGLMVCTGCYKNEPVPSAAFTFTATNQFRIPCTVTFANQSVNAFSYYWTFGDDSVSEVKNPVHTYHRPGQYEVYLRAYTESRREWASMIRIIQVRDTLATTR